jgi:hypothetical protein
MSNVDEPGTSGSQQVDQISRSHKSGSGEVDRPTGTVDEDANPPLSDPDDDTVYGGAGTIPPQDTGAAIPPYEGRQTSAKDIGVADDPSTAGATRPEQHSEYRSPKPQDTPGGAAASPAEEQPASQGSETQSDDEGVEPPAQATGTRRGEDKP